MQYAPNNRFFCFRNVYGYNLDSDRIKELLLELPETVDLFTEDVKSFMNLLDQEL